MTFFSGKNSHHEYSNPPAGPWAVRAEQVAAGRYQTEQELVVDAVRVLRELRPGSSNSMKTFG